MDFCSVVRWVYPPYTLSGPTTTKTLFYVCLPLSSLNKSELQCYLCRLELVSTFDQPVDLLLLAVRDDELAVDDVDVP